MKGNKKKIKYVLLLFIFIFAFQIIKVNIENSSIELNNIEDLGNSAEELYHNQWISNTNFDSLDNWTSIKGEFGDQNDINGHISGGTANYEILGEKRTFSLVETPINGSKWTAVPNPEFPHGPTSNFTDSEGLKVYHEFDDHDANQNPSVHWDRNVSTFVDMSDYEIKSAFIQAVVSASVDRDVDCPGDTIATDGGANLNQRESYDYVRFYVLISDLPKNKVYEIAYLQPTDLGQGNPPGDDTLPDTYLIPYSEEDLIYFLTSVLSTDNFNFTITLGIRIYTADNSDTYDNDEFHELLIKSVNLTFTYEKKINPQTSFSWVQVGEKVSDNIPITNYTSFQITEALLYFEYMINDTWVSSSRNSEIRVLINNIIYTESIKLSTANQTFKEANPNGFDVSSLISDDVNVSIQVYLADDFELNRTIMVSIDNVFLNISYRVSFEDYHTSLQLFLNDVDKTPPIYDPSIEIPIGQNITITVKYTNQTGGHIPNANVQLSGVSFTKDLKEFANNYSITLNSTLHLSMGINSLKIEATKTNFETKIYNPTIIVRKIYTEIMTVSGGNTINIDVGESVQLEIMLNDTDNDKLIKGAIVTYKVVDLDPIPRVLTENNGIYEGEIVTPPEGPYTIIISAYAGEYYEFNDFEIALYVGTYVPQPQPDWSWLIYTLIGAILGLVLVFTLYQTHFKYPPLVRKIRKLKKKVRKGNKTKPIPVNKREEIIKDNIQEHARILDLEFTQSKRKSVDKIDLKEKAI
ncbi:MAG: hypothetical protein ACFE9N_10735 [Promethearchaeota archaeon]